MMAVTHYWKRPTELPAAAFRAAVADFRKLLANANNELAGFDGSGTPLIDDERIVFNGLRPKSAEPFEIARVEFDRRGRDIVCSYWETGHLPYATYVQASLIILKHHIDAELEVASDVPDSDWQPARDLVIDALGYGATFLLDA